MTDYMDFDCVPCEEKCESVGMPGYDPMKARAECRAYLRQILRIFGEPPDGCQLVVKSNPHEFGDYLTVVAKFGSSDKRALRWALRVERNLRSRWDGEACNELGIPTMPENMIPENLFSDQEDYDD